MSWIGGSVIQSTAKLWTTGIYTRIPRTAQLNQRFLVYFMVMIDDLLRGHTFLFRGQGDWGAVFVRATAHEHVTSPRSLVPELDVGWQTVTSYMT